MSNLTGLAALCKVAEEHGGKCLSSDYTNARAHYRFMCAHGHEWQARACNVLSGRWCRECYYQSQRGTTKSELTCQRIALARREPDGLAKLQAIAKKHGGICISREYHTAVTRYEFRCAQGHQWMTTGAKIFRGTWCRHCKHPRLSLAHAQEAAREKGGLCLSTKYERADVMMTWQCSRGHTWQARFRNLRNQGNWCPDCARIARITNPHSRAWVKYAATKRSD